MVPVILVVAAIMGGGPAPGALCAPFGGVGANHRWLTGEYQVVQVSFEHQAKTLPNVKRGELKSLSRPAAQAIVGDRVLPKVPHYYLIRVGYVGPSLPGTFDNVSLGVDVDSDGVAYVSSFVLSSMTTKSDAVAILASATPIRRIISSCGSAE